MRLTRRDLTATGLTTVAVAYYVAYVRGFDFPPLSDVRFVAVVVFLLGLAAGVVGGDLFRIGESGSIDRGLLVESLLSMVAMLSATGALLVGSGVLLALLVAVVALFWVVGIVRHLALPAPAVRRTSWVQPAHDRLDGRVHR